MSALLDQFIEEAGDLLDAAGAALLLLERNPADSRAVNDLFRSVHTLKGTSALFEFPALTKLVHAGEDLLDAVRDGAVAVSADLVDVQLEVLDLLRSWIDAVRATGDLPPDAVASSRDLIARLAASKTGRAIAEAAPSAAHGPDDEPQWDWPTTLPESDRIAAFRFAVEERAGIAALEYSPDTDCYFRGEDPMLTVRNLPDLLALSIEPVGPPVSLDEFDPYQCRLRFRALSTAPRAELEHLFRYVSDQIRIVAIEPSRLAVPAGAAGSNADLRDFIKRSDGWIRGGQLSEMRERALELLPAIDAGWCAASGLRWLIAVVDSGAVLPQLLLELANAAGGHVAAIPVNGGGTARIAPSDIVDRVVDEQRRILALPADDLSALVAGRIAAVGRTLANVALAQGALDAAAELEAATALALQLGNPDALIVAADTIFGGGHPGLPAGSAASRAATGKPEPPAGSREPRHPRVLKVDQAKVDRLMALIGELVVAKNALPFLARRAEHVHGSRDMSREIGQRYSVIDRLAQEMQEAIMEVRLLPVSEVFARFPRLIRDTARKLDKQIELVLEGEETRADKNIIELLGDPLIHIVRNAADHGIESPQTRVANGKPAHGTIRLKAMQEGDLVVIEVSDDGRGVDTKRVIAKALERGLIEPEAAQAMTAAEADNLIFHPGLSTADHVSDLSGRGVGMDVVQTSIRDAGGSVSVSSRPGLGTTVRLAMPLSMAVMRVMTIETAGAIYGVPIDLIAETVRVDAVQIRRLKQAEAFLLRDAIIPIVRLRRLLHLPACYEEREAVLVLRTETGLIGLIVDRFDEHMDIILKPLEGILVGLKGFAGTALLGDGRVLMVLNVKELL